MQKRKSMISNKHLSVESLYLYADPVFGYENWLHEIKNQTSLFMIIFFCKILIMFKLYLIENYHKEASLILNDSLNVLLF